MSAAKTTDKTPTANLPVLGRPQCETEDDFALFADHLARWAAQWVPTISVPVMRKAQALYDDTAVCILLGKWYDLKLKTVRDMHERLLRAAMDDEWSWESEGAEDEFEYSSNLDRDLLFGYNQALYALLVG